MFLGQIYHRIGSILPNDQGDCKFLQVYFIGDNDQELNQRCINNKDTNRTIINNLQSFFHANNHLVKLFQYALEKMPKNECKIVLKADKIPTNDHKKRFSLPTIDDIAIIMVEGEKNSRDIILTKRDHDLRRISETHKSYDALQYPILFWQGNDGYHFKILQNNSTKKVNSNQFLITSSYKINR